MKRWSKPLAQEDKVEAVFMVLQVLEELGHTDRRIQAAICSGAMMKALSHLEEGEAHFNFDAIQKTMAKSLDRYYREKADAGRSH